MAFYFALFNVSHANRELREHNREHRSRGRRRHSISAVGNHHSSKDYRLLPKPQILFHESQENDTESTSLPDDEDSAATLRSSLRSGDSVRSRRRASSPDPRRGIIEERPSQPPPPPPPHAMDTAFMGPKRLKEVESRLRRVKFGDESAEPPIWIKSPSPTRHPVRHYDQCFPMRAEIIEKPNGMSKSLINEELWIYSPNENDRRISTDTTTTSGTSADWSSEALLGPLVLDSDSSMSAIWRRRPSLGVSGVQIRDSAKKSPNLSAGLKDQIRQHVNTWPELRRSRWRPSSLIRRHSCGAADDPSLPPPPIRRQLSATKFPQKPIVVITPTERTARRSLRDDPQILRAAAEAAAQKRRRRQNGGN